MGWEAERRSRAGMGDEVGERESDRDALQIVARGETYPMARTMRPAACLARK
jgi:hypothetical protein